MKQINDIPVRRRPHSKDANQGDEAVRSRRQIWQIEAEAGLNDAADPGPEAAQSPAPAPAPMPEPQPARPRSTPLILTPDSATDVPRHRDPSTKPVDAPAAASGHAAAPLPPVTRITEGPSAEHAAPQKRGAVSRPRVAEPTMDDAGRTQQPQASSLRQRSRPIMPSAPEQPAQTRPAPPPQASKVNRAKTRILGFHAADVAPDPLAQAADAAPSKPSGYAGQFPVGWFVIVDGPGLGACFTITTGVSTIGRGEDQAISLDFGDQSVSRSGHASVAFDEEQKKFFIGHGGKSNVVRRNGAPVLATEEMEHSDIIRIGKTSLRFVAFCGADFTWDAAEDNNG